MKIEIMRMSNGIGGQQWKVTAPGHSTYHRHVEEAVLVVKILMQQHEVDAGRVPEAGGDHG